MGDLMPRESARVLSGTDPLAPRLPARVQRAIDRESGRALASAARAQAAGFVAEARIGALELVTERAMLGLARLHQIEAAMAKQDPIVAEQYAGLVDDYLMLARGELRCTREEF
jgi:hypothetical protein